MNYLTHRDRFMCIHGGVFGAAAYALEDDSRRCTIAGADGRILLEEELLNIGAERMKSICPALPLNVKCNKFAAVIPTSPDKFRINGKRPVVRGAIVLTDMGPAFHLPDPLSSAKFASLVPLASLERGPMPVAAKVAKRSETRTIEKLLFVKCKLNGEAALASSKYRLFVEGTDRAIEGTTDQAGCVKEHVQIEIGRDARAYLEVATPIGGVVVYQLILTAKTADDPNWVANLGFDPGADEAVSSYFTLDGQPRNRDWLGQRELAALGLDDDSNGGATGIA